MRLCIYSRKSKATLKGDSIGNQIDMCKSYILSKFPEVQDSDIDVYEDDGFSGKNVRRPGFARMMERIEKGAYTYLVVYRLDRISRSVGDFADILKVLERTDTRFISINEQFDTSSAIGRAMMSIASVFAQMERETISERVTDNMLLLSHTGCWLGGRTPAGFRAQRVEADPANGIPKAHSVLVEDPEAMQPVRRAFEIYLRLGAIRATIQELHQRNIRLGDARQLSDHALKQLLTNPVYCAADQDAYDYFYEQGCVLPADRADFDGQHGCMPYNRHKLKPGRGYLREPSEWIIAIGQHTGLIPGSTWADIQRRLQRSAALHPRQPSARNDYALLTGMMVCARCGSPMYTQPQNSGRNDAGGFTYLCQRRKNLGKAACDCPSVSGKRLDQAVRDMLSQYSTEGSALAQQLSALKVSQPNAQAGVLARQQAALARLELRMRTLVERLADPDLPAAALDMAKEQLRELAAETEAAREDVARLQADKATEDRAQQGYEAICRILERFSGQDSLSIPQQRDLLRRVIDRVTWDGQHADIFPCGRQRAPLPPAAAATFKTGS